MSIDPYEWDVCSLAKHAEALAAERDAAIAERDSLRELIRAYVRDDSGDTWGALLRAVGYDCE